MPRVQLWIVTLMLTGFGIALVIVVHVLTLRYFYATIGDGIYLILLAVAGAISVLIARVVRWLNRDQRAS